MRHRCILNLDSQLLGKFLKFAGCEVDVVVGNDAVGHTVSIDDGLKELDSCGCFLVDYWCQFNPFGELVNYD
jgi:hypothetical protein